MDSRVAGRVVAGSVHTRGPQLELDSAGATESSAAAAVCTDSSRIIASAALQHFELKARKRSDYLPVGDDRAVDDRVVEILVVHEGVNVQRADSGSA